MHQALRLREHPHPQPHRALAEDTGANPPQVSGGMLTESGVLMARVQIPTEAQPKSSGVQKICMGNDLED